MERFKQAIRIGRNVTSIFNLPCIFSCHKDDGMNPVYLLHDWDDNGNYIEARPGDWLCEDHEGVWCVLSNEEYKKLKKATEKDRKTILFTMPR